MDLNEFVNTSIESLLSRVSTSFIGKIVAINEDLTVNIQVVLNVKIDEKELKVPIIENVPFLQNYSSTGFCSLNFQVKDYVLCIALQKDHSKFFENLEEAAAATKRKHDINNIVALPFFYSSKHKIEEEIEGFTVKNYKKIKLDTNETALIEILDNIININADEKISLNAKNSILLNQGNNSINLKDKIDIKTDKSISLNLNNLCFIEMKDNKLKIEANGINVLGLLEQTLIALAATTVNTAAGPAPLNNALAFTQIQTQLAQIKS